jgi:molybdopterin/thiamine biosynthesis adenylyltransferase
MSATVVITEKIYEELFAAAKLTVESAAVLLVRILYVDGQSTRILARELVWISDEYIITRNIDGLLIRSEGYISSLAAAEALGATCLWVHTHPGKGAIPMPSNHDAVVDTQLNDVFRIRTGSEYYGTLICSNIDDRLEFTGTLQHRDYWQAIERMWVVGRRFQLSRAFDSKMPPLPRIFERSVLAFGEAVQQTLADLYVGVVGCGGIGSSVVEQLARLGVRRILLIDPDRLSESNVTRVYGTGPGDVGEYKTKILENHIRSISATCECVTINSTINIESVARALLVCDIIFGCTDDNAGRLVLSRLSTYCMIPVIDSGVLISNRVDNSIEGIDGRITILSPGNACLVCRGRIDIRRASSELLTPTERKKRVDEGYAPALGRIEPSVIAYTTMIASVALSELLERLIGYGPEDRPSEILIRCHERQISTNARPPNKGHYCDLNSGKIGMGETIPFLDQLWPEES